MENNQEHESIAKKLIQIPLFLMWVVIGLPIFAVAAYQEKKDAKKRQKDLDSPIIHHYVKPKAYTIKYEDKTVENKNRLHLK